VDEEVLQDVVVIYRNLAVEGALLRTSLGKDLPLACNGLELPTR